MQSNYGLINRGQVIEKHGNNGTQRQIPTTNTRIFNKSRHDKSRHDKSLTINRLKLIY